MNLGFNRKSNRLSIDRLTFRLNLGFNRKLNPLSIAIEFRIQSEIQSLEFPIGFGIQSEIQSFEFPISCSIDFQIQSEIQSCEFPLEFGIQSAIYIGLPQKILKIQMIRRYADQHEANKTYIGCLNRNFNRVNHIIHVHVGCPMQSTCANNEMYQKWLLDLKIRSRS